MSSLRPRLNDIVSASPALTIPAIEDPRERQRDWQSDGAKNDQAFRNAHVPGNPDCQANARSASFETTS
jgi:hypothetical protein